MQSLHNFNPALAFDVAPVRNGKCVWDVTDPVWPFIGKCCKKLGLDWGGSWKSFKDYPHIQMTKSMALELKNVDTKAILLLK